MEWNSTGNRVWGFQCERVELGHGGTLHCRPGTSSPEGNAKEKLTTDLGTHHGDTEARRKTKNLTTKDTKEHEDIARKSDNTDQNRLPKLPRLPKSPKLKNKTNRGDTEALRKTKKLNHNLTTKDAKEREGKNLPRIQELTTETRRHGEKPRT
jgi:hypothetical protein